MSFALPPNEHVRGAKGARRLGRSAQGSGQAPLSLLVRLPISRKGNPGFPLSLIDRVRRLGKISVCETAAGDADLFRKCRHEPKERGATDRAEVARLVMVLRRVVKRIDIRFARSAYDGRSVEVSRDPERTAGSPLAVGAMANAMHRGQSIYGNGSLFAGACCCHCQGLSAGETEILRRTTV